MKVRVVILLEVPEDTELGTVDEITEVLREGLGAGSDTKVTCESAEIVDDASPAL